MTQQPIETPEHIQVNWSRFPPIEVPKKRLPLPYVEIVTWNFCSNPLAYATEKLERVSEGDAGCPDSTIGAAVIPGYGVQPDMERVHDFSKGRKFI